MSNSVQSHRAACTNWIIADTQAQIDELLESAEDGSAVAELMDEKGKVAAKALKAAIDEIRSKIQSEEIDALMALLNALPMKKKDMDKYLAVHPLCASARNDKGNVNASSIKARIAELRATTPVPEKYAEDYEQLMTLYTLMTKNDEQSKLVKALKAALEQLVKDKYPVLTVDEIKELLVNKKWYYSIFDGIKTPEKYYLEWKKDGFTQYPEERHEMDVHIEEVCATIPNKLDSALFAMFYKARFLNLIHNFLIFDKGQKKVCRYNQYYGIMRAQKRLLSGKGGIIWHTQGSGKSLTMIWLSKWLLSNIPTARVLIVTDRDELDEQIERNYKGVNETIIRTKSGADLLARLNSHEDRLLCSLVHKFGKRGGEATAKDYDRYIEELKASLPTNFSAKDDIFVFVDECHRTQSGKLHLAMKTIMPNAIFVGFTGTPLLKSDRATSIEVFGRYIHSYKFDEGVADGVVLDLRYEYRDIPQEIMSQDRIDAWFEAKTRGLMPRAKARLKQVWGNMQTVYSSRDRLEKIVCDIIFDFETKARLADGSGNAILVADDILAACKYY